MVESPAHAWTEIWTWYVKPSLDPSEMPSSARKGSAFAPEERVEERAMSVELDPPSAVGSCFLVRISLAQKEQATESSGGRVDPRLLQLTFTAGQRV